MAVSLDGNSSDGEKGGNAEGSKERDFPKVCEPEMKKPELEEHVAISLDPTFTNKEIENEATPESSLSTSPSTPRDDSTSSPSSISSSPTSPSSPSQTPEPTQTPASDSPSRSNTKVAGGYFTPRPPREFTSQKRPEPIREKAKGVKFLDLRIIPKPPQTPTPSQITTSQRPKEPLTPGTSMAIDVPPSPTGPTFSIITPRNSTPISLPSTSAAVPRIFTGGPVVAAAGTAANNAFNAFNIRSSASNTTPQGKPIEPIPVIHSTRVVPKPSHPLFISSASGNQASASLNVLSKLSPNHGSPSSIPRIPPVLAGFKPTNVLSPPDPSRWKGKARATDQDFIDWANLEDLVDGCSHQREQVSSGYQSKPHVEYGTVASGSSTPAEKSAPSLTKTQSQSSQIKGDTRKKLPPIPEQGEEIEDVREEGEVETSIPVITVTPPEDEVMVEGVDDGAQPNANVSTFLQAPRNIKARSSSVNINGSAKKPPLSPSVDMEEGGVQSSSLPTTNASQPRSIAIPQLAALVPSIPPVAEESEEELPANFSPPSFATALPAPRPSSPFQTSAASFGLRTSPKQSPAHISREPAMEIDEELAGRLFVSEPTPDRRYLSSGLHTDPDNLPPLPTLFGVRTFSTLTRNFKAAPPALPPREEGEDKMDEDILPLLDRVRPANDGVSLLSRISSLKPGISSIAPSLSNAPPLGDDPQPTTLFASAPPLGASSAPPSAIPPLGSPPALGLYTAQRDRPTHVPTVAAAPAHWPKWDDLSAAWGAPTPAPTATRPPVQPSLSLAPTQMQTPPSSPCVASPLDLANAFWASASDKVRLTPVVEQRRLQDDDSSTSEPDYDSDSSSASWWGSTSDSEDDFDRSVKSNGVLTPPRLRPDRHLRFGLPSRQSSAGMLRIAPHVVLTLTLLGLKRDRGDGDESSDNSDDENFFSGGKRQRRYKAPGDAFVRDQIRRVFKASAKRSPSIANISLPSSPLSSPSDLPLKSLPLPPAKGQYASPNDNDVSPLNLLSIH